MEAGDAKAFEDLQKVLKRLKKALPDGEKDRMYVYMLPTVLCGLIVPAEVEEAIRMGEMETVSLSKNCDKALFKGEFVCMFVCFWETRRMLRYAPRFHRKIL
jgi:hypothetical protein